MRLFWDGKAIRSETGEELEGVVSEIETFNAGEVTVVRFSVLMEGAPEMDEARVRDTVEALIRMEEITGG